MNCLMLILIIMDGFLISRVSLNVCISAPTPSPIREQCPGQAAPGGSDLERDPGTRRRVREVPRLRNSGKIFCILGLLGSLEDFLYQWSY